MKKILFLLLFTSQILLSQNGFEKGNELYRKGNFAEAVNAYEEVLKTKKESAELYFNLGNSYYKINKVGPAIYNYEKALLLDPADKDIKNNLIFAQKLQIDDIKEVPKVGFSKAVSTFTSAFHYDTWAWISVAAAVIFLLLFSGYYFTNTALYKRIFFGAMFVAALLIVLSIVSAMFEKDRFISERPAIVFASIAAVKSEPNKNAPDAFVLHEGTKVRILESLENWRKIELPDENQGWIDTADIKEL